MRKHPHYVALEGFKKIHGITNAAIAEALGISERSVINKNIGVSDYYLYEVDILEKTLGIPTSLFLL